MIGDDLQQRVTKLNGLVQLQDEQISLQNRTIEQLMQRIETLTNQNSSGDVQTLSEKVNNHTMQLGEISRQLDGPDDVKITSIDTKLNETVRSLKGIEDDLAILNQTLQESRADTRLTQDRFSELNETVPGLREDIRSLSSKIVSQNESIVQLMSTTDVLRSDLTEGSSLTIKDIEEELEIHANRLQNAEAIGQYLVCYYFICILNEKYSFLKMTLFIL